MLPTVATPGVAQPQQARRGDGDADRDQRRRRARQEPLQPEDHHEQHSADRDQWRARSCGRCCTIASKSRKKPALSMWMPSSFGIWSTTITRPMPDLNPVSTGSEMKFATKPSRSTDAATSMAPISTASVAPAAISVAGVAVGRHAAEFGGDEDRDRRGRADAERARRAEQRVDHHRHERGVEADLQRQARDRGVGHRLGDDHGGRGQARDDVEAQPFARVLAQPGDARDEA